MSARRSARRSPGCPGPVHLQFRGNEGQLDADEADLDPWFEPRPPRSRPSGSHRRRCDPAGTRRFCTARSARHRGGGGVRASGAGRNLVALAERLGSRSSLAQRQRFDPGTHPLSWAWWAPTRGKARTGSWRSRRGLLRRHPDGQHDDALLAGPAGRARASRSTSTRRSSDGTTRSRPRFFRREGSPARMSSGDARQRGRADGLAGESGRRPEQWYAEVHSPLTPRPYPSGPSASAPN